MTCRRICSRHVMVDFRHYCMFSIRLLKYFTCMFFHFLPHVKNKPSLSPICIALGICPSVCREVTLSGLRDVRPQDLSLSLPLSLSLSLPPPPLFS